MTLRAALLDVMECHPEIAVLGQRLVWLAILIVALAFMPGCAHAPPAPRCEVQNSFEACKALCPANTHVVAVIEIEGGLFRCSCEQDPT